MAEHPGRWTARNRRIGSIIAVGTAIVLGVLTLLVVIDGAALPGELGIVRWSQSLGEPVPSLAEFVRTTTSTDACIVAALPAVWWSIRRHGRRSAPAILIALSSLLVAQPVTKELIDRPRPTSEQVEVRAEHTSMSYPSGHSMSTATVWGAASLYAWRTRRHGLAAALAVPVVVTGMASSIQGVHWPSDALAGTMLGTFAAWWIVRTLLGPVRRPPAPDLHRA